jgi:hypothetical protein
MALEHPRTLTDTFWEVSVGGRVECDLDIGSSNNNLRRNNTFTTPQATASGGSLWVPGDTHRFLDKWVSRSAFRRDRFKVQVFHSIHQPEIISKLINQVLIIHDWLLRTFLVEIKYTLVYQNDSQIYRRYKHELDTKDSHHLSY